MHLGIFFPHRKTRVCLAQAENNQNNFASGFKEKTWDTQLR